MLTGKDPLRRRRPNTPDSYWLEHPASPTDPNAYFSEDLPDANQSFLVTLFITLSKFWNRGPKDSASSASPTNTPADEIPDDIYTMW
jgi:hypothetical protein